MSVDIGGIGKGFAADKAAEVMRQKGARAGVVALSGDIKTFGVLPDGEQFVFGIQHPRDRERLLGKIQLENEAVSTAGDYQQFFMENGVRYHHILDPDTLYPARGCQSVTVIAKEGVWADGLDTGIFVMGVEKGMKLNRDLVRSRRDYCQSRREGPYVFRVTQESVRSESELTRFTCTPCPKN